MPYRPKIGLEVLNIHNIKSHNRCIRPQVQLGHGLSENEGSSVLGQQRFELVERSEKRYYTCLIGFLRAREPGFVDADVDVVVQPGGYVINLLAVF